MILALDAGNTNICVGCIDETGCHMTARIATDRSITEDEYAVILGSILHLNGISPETLTGSIIYKACVALALSLGLVPQDLKLVTAVLFLLILVLGGARRKKVKFNA